MRLTREAGNVQRVRWNAGIACIFDNWVYYAFDVEKAAAANISASLIWAGFEYAAGTAGQVTDLDNFFVCNFGAA